MRSISRVVLFVALLGVFAVSLAPQADAGIFVRRWGPVRAAARVALPPYPVARRVAYGPIYRPVYRPVVAAPVGYWGGPVVYGPGVSVAVGW